MIDTHCHLNLEPLAFNASTHIQDAKNVEVEKLVVVGTDIVSSKKAVEIAEKNQVFSAVGLHPDLDLFFRLFSTSVREQLLEMWVGELRRLCESPTCLAIGECGLDYSRMVSETHLSDELQRIQQELFLFQANLAWSLGKPLLIHCRNTKNNQQTLADAYSDLSNSLETLYSKEKLPSFVLHCVSGPYSYIEKCLKLGGYVSFAGNVTYPSAGGIREILHAVPLNRILVETDAPFLSPQGKRGTMNVPANVKDTAAFIAKELGISYSELDAHVMANARAFFSF